MHVALPENSPNLHCPPAVGSFHISECRRWPTHGAVQTEFRAACSWVRSYREWVPCFSCSSPWSLLLVHLFFFLHPQIRFNISTPAFRGCMKNLKKTTGVVRLNDTVGVTKKCSEDWKVSEEFRTLQSSGPQLTHVWLSLTHQLLTYSDMMNWLIYYTLPVLAKPLQACVLNL